jgi:hypothetical protein
MPPHDRTSLDTATPILISLETVYGAHSPDGNSRSGSAGDPLTCQW